MPRKVLQFYELTGYGYGYCSMQVKSFYSTPIDIALSNLHRLENIVTRR